MNFNFYYPVLSDLLKLLKYKQNVSFNFRYPAPSISNVDLVFLFILLFLN